MRKENKVETIQKTTTEYSFTKEELQKIVDVIFSLCMASREWSKPGWESRSGTENKPAWDNTEDHMKWVASQLGEFGLKTIPMGCSWGVLK